MRYRKSRERHETPIYNMLPGELVGEKQLQFLACHGQHVRELDVIKVEKYYSGGERGRAIFVIGGRHLLVMHAVVSILRMPCFRLTRLA